MGFWGVSFYQIEAGHIFNDVPYPLLTSHIGNEQFVYTSIAFNGLDFYEFVSQSYASLRYQHFFEGFIMNRIPLMRKLKWRLVGTGNILFGSVSQSTLDIQAAQDEQGNALIQDDMGNALPLFNTLESGRPYAEIGVGIENIFKVFRIDYIKRLTYLNPQASDNNSIKLSFNLSL